METTLGQDLVARRREKGMTLRGVAREIGVSASLLSLIEQNKHTPSRNLLVNLAELLDADADRWCALAGTITPQAEAALAVLAREDPEGYRFLRTLVERRNGDP